MSETLRLHIFRYLRISIATGIATAIWLIFNFERGYWIPLNLVIIYTLFDPGLVSNRMIRRLFGTLLGLFIGLILVKFLMLYPNTLIILAIIIVFFTTYFFAMEAFYTYYTIFMIIWITVILAFVPTADLISPERFLIDRLLDTFIAVCIIFIADVIFRPKKLIKANINLTFEQIFKAYKEYLTYLIKNDKTNNDLNPKLLNKFSESVNKLKQIIEVNLLKLHKNERNIIQSCITNNYSIKASALSIQYLIYKYDKDLQRYLEDNKANIIQLIDDFELSNNNFLISSQTFSYYSNNVVEEKFVRNLNNIRDNLININKELREFKVA